METAPLLGSPFFIISTNSMPLITLPKAEYWRSKCGADWKQIKNWLFALLGSDDLAADIIPLVWAISENSAFKLGRSEPPVPAKDILKSELPRGRWGKVGSAFLKSNLLRIKKRLDHAEHGGALLLGVNGICVIGHGSSKSLSVVSALRLAHSAVNHNVMKNLNQLQNLQVLDS